MSLVEREDMTKLRTAAESLETALTAADEIQKKAIAHVINSAANTGETRAIYQSDISEANWQELESKGYKVEYVQYEAALKNILISWKPEPNNG